MSPSLTFIYIIPSTCKHAHTRLHGKSDQSFYSLNILFLASSFQVTPLYPSGSLSLSLSVSLSLSIWLSLFHHSKTCCSLHLRIQFNCRFQQLVISKQDNSLFNIQVALTQILSHNQKKYFYTNFHSYKILGNSCRILNFFKFIF